MSDPRTLEPTTQSGKPQVRGADTSRDGAVGAVGSADVKAQVRAASGQGFAAQEGLVTPPSDGPKKADPTKAPAHADQAKNASALAQKDALRGHAPAEVATPKGNARRYYGPSGPGAEATDHSGSSEVTAYTDANGGLAVKGTRETRPLDGQGVGLKAVAEAGYGPTGAAFKAGGDVAVGQHPDDMLAADPTAKAGIAKQDLTSLGGTVGVSNLDGDATNVKTELDLRAGRNRSVAGDEGKNELRGVDGGLNVKAGEKGIEAVAARGTATTTLEDGTKSATGGIAGYDLVNNKATVGVTHGVTRGDKSGYGVDGSATIGDGSADLKAGGHLVGADGKRSSGSIGVGGDWKVSDPTQDGDSWVIDVTYGLRGQVGAGRGATHAASGTSASAGGAVSGFETRNPSVASRRRPRQPPSKSVSIAVPQPSVSPPLSGLRTLPRWRSGIRMKPSAV